MRLEDSLSNTHPLIKKKKKEKTCKPLKKHQPLIPKTKKQKTNNANPKTQTIFPDQNSDSLKLAILHCTSIYTQIGLACSNPSNRWTKKYLCNSENLCSFFAIVKTENLCSSSSTTDNLDAIPSLLFNNKQFRR